jgi:ribosomal protein S18 acetylase RimI-like enzyme
MAPAVHPATLEDVPSLVGLMQDFYAEAPSPFDRQQATDTFDRLLRDPARGAVWLLEADSEAAGYIVLTVGFSLEYGGLDAFVDDLYVRPRFRRQGLGRLALEALFAECRRRGVRAVHLEVGRANDAAKALYARFGFRDNDRQLLTVSLLQDPNAA